MNVKQLKRLEQMPPPDKRREVAEGLTAISSNVESLLAEFEQIWQKAPRSCLLLKGLAEEEAGKAFLLIDYLRAPKNSSKPDRSRHLAWAYDHLARGIYVEYYSSRPASFGEAVGLVESERLSYYLDGPDGFEWIYRNAIQQKREEALYVDLIDRDGTLIWQSPDRLAQFARPLSPRQPPICRLLLDMVHAQLLSQDSLEILEMIWSDIALTPDTHWQECYKANLRFLELVQRSGVLIPEAIIRTVGWHLLFPLTGLDLSQNKVDRRLLEQQRG